MGVHSGKFAIVDGVPSIRNWSIEDAQELVSSVNSGTMMGTARTKGVQSWTGSYLQDAINPVAMPGDTIAFKGYTAPNNDTLGGVGETYSGSAVVDELQVTFDWSTNAILQILTNFTGHLALTRTPADTAPTDVATPIIKPTACAGKIEYHPTAVKTSPVEWTNITQAVLTITANNQTYVNSSTCINNELWTGVKSGNIDWNLAVTEEDDDVSKFTKGDLQQLRLWVDATNFWELVWGRIKDITGITADVEGGGIISRTVNIEMSAVDDAGAPGRILRPSDVQASPWWGVADPP